jgi:hypothetical protein
MLREDAKHTYLKTKFTNTKTYRTIFVIPTLRNHMNIWFAKMNMQTYVYYFIETIIAIPEFPVKPE